MFKIWVAITLLLASMAGALVGVANAATPGDTLYSLDRQVETWRLKTTFRPESSLRLQLTIAQERLDEAQRLYNRQQFDQASQAITDFETSVAALSAFATANGGQKVSDIMDAAFQRRYLQQNAIDNRSSCSGEDQRHPFGQSLADRLGIQYQEVMDWFCSGYGFGEIQLAYEIQTRGELSVEELFTLRDAGLGWGEVMQAAGLFENLAPSQHQPPPAGSQPSQSGNVKPPAPAAQGNCKNNYSHPHAQTLAQEFDVSPETIGDYFCSGYGFGEIKLAYQIGQHADIDVDEVFDQHSTGASWGEIMQNYGLVGSNKDKTKPEKSGDADSKPKPSKEPKPERPEKPAKPEKTEKPVKPEKTPKPEKTQKPKR